MTMDFSQADRQKDFTELLPQGTLSWGILKIKPHNLDADIWETPSQSSDARYLNCQVHLKGGRYDSRVIFTRIGTAGKDVYINMGRASIRAILEVGKQASEQNLAGYNISHYKELNGLPVAIKIKEEPEQNGYPAKNDVAVFLSPVDPVTKKDFERLVNGDTEPKGKQNIRSGDNTKTQVAQTAARWAQGGEQAAPAPTQPAVDPNQPPPWLTPQNPGQQPAGQPAQNQSGQPAQSGTEQGQTAPQQQAMQPATPPWATGQQG